MNQAEIAFTDVVAIVEAYLKLLDRHLAKYQQWQTLEKKAEKISITATVHVLFKDLRAQLNGFPIHRYIKIMQAVHFAKLIAKSNGSAVVLQVSFSENAVLV